MNQYGCLDIGTRVRLSGTDKYGIVLQSFGKPLESVVVRRKGQKGVEEMARLSYSSESKIKFDNGEVRTYPIEMLEIL